MSWKTVPQCGSCWANENPMREPARIQPEFRETERCFTCGEETISGIYVRKEVNNG